MIYLVAGIGLLGFHNAIWVFAATLKTASADLTASLVFYKLEFLGVLPNTVVAIVVALAYVGKDRWITRRTVALLSIVPAAFILLTVVNPGNVMIVDPTLIPAQGIMAFEHAFPPLFSVYLAWIYGSILLTILIIARGMVADRVPATPALVAIVALVFPLVTGVMKTAGIYPAGGDGINITPAASAIGISVLAVAIIRYRVFEWIPVGRDHAIEVLDDGYLLVGPTQTVLDANPAAAELLTGDADTELKSRPLTELAPELDALTETTSLDFDTEGRTVEVRRSTVTRQHQEAGDILLVQDVTETQQRERELERQIERLDQVATTVSHDIRNPLTVAQLRLDLARETHDSEDLAAVNTALDRIETLIDDVLHLARQGQPIAETEEVRLAVIAEQCWEVVATHEGTMTVDGDITFQADADRLQQLLENLFRNAIEHGRDDVRIRVGALDDQAGFYVADDGPGIPDNEQDEVFETGYSTADEGTGFGLAIVTEIVDAHDWTITITESWADGARFEIRGVRA